MLSNCSAGEDSWEPFKSKSILKEISPEHSLEGPHCRDYLSKPGSSGVCSEGRAAGFTHGLDIGEKEKRGDQHGKVCGLISWSYHSPGGGKEARFRAMMPKTRPLCTRAKLNLGDRVLGEVEKNRFIALPVKGGHVVLQGRSLLYLPLPARQ